MEAGHQVPVRQTPGDQLGGTSNKAVTVIDNVGVSVGQVGVTTGPATYNNNQSGGPSKRNNK